ncbi:TIGR02099 family protein [Limnobacter humi]|uniref:TIGR02099 family protein n=1 Tax=Limnobacter humi TaxID=1778671 RepID=A0ABT1WHL2_9BURK|nr:YhdP family protein [Limnobacter humi]MCQ8896996.1 TIGR02099 family protein [Limnobacter humi]
MLDESTPVEITTPIAVDPWHRARTWAFWALASLYIPLCLVLIALKWWLLPQVDSYRPRLEQWLSVQTGQPVKLGSLKAQWTGLSPQITLEGLRIVRPDGTPGFETPLVRMDWSLPSLLAFNPNLSNLEIHSPVLQVRRLTDGVFELAGIRMVPDGRTDNPLVDWLLRQRRVYLSDIQVVWQDEQGVWPNAAVTQGEVLMRNGFGQHRLGGELVLPAVGQQPIRLQSRFSTPLWATQPGNLRDWSGVLFTDFKLDNSEPMARLLKLFKLDVGLEAANGRVWVDFAEGRVQGSLIDAHVERFSLSNPDVDSPPFRLTHASALVEVQGEHSLFRPTAITVKNLTGQLSGQRRFGLSHVGLARTEIQNALNWSLIIQNLDVEQARSVARELAPHIGQAEALARLDDYDASGRIDKALLTWKTPASPPGAEAVGGGQVDLAFQSDVAFRGLTLLHTSERQTKGMPVRKQVTGFRNLSGFFRGSNRSGQWQITGQQSSIALPELFESPSLEFAALSGQGHWANLLTPGTPLDVTIQQLRVSNPDLTADVQGNYRFVEQGDDVMNLQGNLEQAQIQRVPKYLPLVVGESARSWLQTALKGGVARQGQFVIEGKVSDFPYGEARYPGRFKIDIPLTDGELQFAPDWPDISNIQGRAVFEGKSMRIVADSAETQGVPLRNVEAKIADLGAAKTVLTVDGFGEGELNNMVAYVNNSPVSNLLGQALSKADTEGFARLSLGLRIPLDAVQNTEVKGSLQLKGNAIKLVRGMPKVTALDGSIGFSNKGLRIDQLQGQALGAPVQIKGSTDASGRMDIRATGNARAAGLAQYLNPLIEPYLAGSTPYSVLVSSRGNRLDIDINSQLQGLEVKLPTPLGKKADGRLPLRIQQSISNNTSRWTVDLGPDLSNPNASSAMAGQLRALVTERGEQADVDSLQFVIGTPLPVPTPGIQGDVRVATLDVDTWRAIYEQISGETSGRKGGSQKPTGLLGDWLADTSESAARIRLRVRADKINLSGKPFEGVSLTARTVEKRWQFDVSAKGVDGYFTWVQDKARPEGAVLARFKKLTIPKSLDGGVKKLVDEPASSIPALDVQADDFVMNDLRMGTLTLRALNQTRDEVLSNPQRQREWRLEELKLENPESVTTAKGVWQYTPGLVNQRTDIDISQTVKDAGGLLARLGMNDVFKGGEGTLTGRLRWNDAPTSMDYDSLSGQFKLSSRKGQFLKADPGAAKLLGVLSLQSIPRRFTLDFKDLFSQGFAYDTIEADVTLNEGIATTRNFKMTAPSATVLMDGTLDLDKETQNLNVVVLPDLNATGGSLVYSLIAANPAVGIASLIADFLFKDPISKVFSVQYKVSGPWASPTIERLKKTGEGNNGSVNSGG